MAKVRKLKLSFPHFHHQHSNGMEQVYLVREARDTIAYQPGAYLTTKEVSDLCEMETWSITIVPAGN